VFNKCNWGLTLYNGNLVAYAKNRGISDEIAKRFELGFATPSNNDLLLNFEKTQQSITDLKALGLYNPSDASICVHDTTRKVL
jgi:DNA primase